MGRGESQIGYIANYIDLDREYPSSTYVDTTIPLGDVSWREG